MSTSAAFTAKYVSTNLPAGAPTFAASLIPNFTALPLPPLLSTSVLTAALCALKRGDLVPPLFSHLVDVLHYDPQEVFTAMRTAITSTLVFSGAPQVVPACLGLAGEMKTRGLSPSTFSDRGEILPTTLPLGRETHADIYKASANPEVFQMLGEYFGDVEYGLIAVAFGLYMGGEGLKEKELMLASAILAMGAKRQAGSHLKACFGFGWSGEEVGAAVGLVERTAEWCKSSVPKMDMKALESEAAEAMAKRE